MINYITYDNAIIAMRNAIITQSEIPSARVLNGASLYGPDLQTVLNSKGTSFAHNQDFIIFEMLEDNSSDDNVVIPEANDKMSSITAFNFNLKIYGDNCHMVAQKILSRLKMSVVVQELYDTGIFIRGIETPNAVNEFVNNALWKRCDLTISIVLRFEISPVTQNTEYSDNLTVLGLDKFS